MGELDKQAWVHRTAGRGSITCGCWCCQNPRRRRNSEELTNQERKSLEDFKNQLYIRYKYMNGCIVDLDEEIGCDCYECKPELYQ